MDFIIVLLYLGMTMLNAVIADERGRSVSSALLLSIMLSPLLAYMFLVAVPALPKDKK